MFTTKKIALVSVVNDLVGDARVKKTCLVLMDCGYEVILVGRKLKTSPALPDWPFKARRMNLIFVKGPLFYAEFMTRLFLKLLFKRSHVLYSNDLDTLLPNYLVARFKGIPLIYDSHELFCEVPELQKTPFKKKIWEFLEKKLVPKLKNTVTVSDGIAKIFEDKYKAKFTVVRNIPEEIIIDKIKSKAQLGLPENKKIILLQGAGINIDRGAEELVEAMQWVENILLLIIGRGDVWHQLEERVKSLKLEDKVRMIYRLPKTELLNYTLHSDLGLSLDKDTNLNYHFSLPNKLFDYIHAGIPVLSSRLPELEKIISAYGLGEFIESHEPKHIAQRINEMLNSKDLDSYRKAAIKARTELTWENEKQKLVEVIKRV